MKTKVKIIREIENVKDGFFLVYAGDKHLKAFSFNPAAKKDSDYTEEKIRAKAFEFAKLIEQYGHESIKEVVYETPETL